jgi:hypothetical protein
MVEDWELKSVERRIDSLEKSIERVRESVREERDKARAEKDKAQAEKWRRQDRRMDISIAVYWTVYVAAVTTFIVLVATGQLHHH